MRRFLALAVLALASAVPAAAQENSGLSIRLLDAPSDRSDDSRARTYIVDHLHQGDRIERRVELGNGTGEPLEVELYAAAATLEDGAFRFGEGRAENDLTSWTRLDPPRLTIAPGGTATSTVRVAIPEDALDGERYAVVWAQLPGSGGATSVVNRVGVRMYVSVGEGEEPVTDFRIDTLAAGRDDDGTPVVRTRVTNTGGRAVDLSGTLRLDDGPGSLSAGPFDLEIGTTLGPGDSAPAVVRLDDDIPAGPWEATVEVRSGTVERQAKATITFPDGAGEVAEPVQAESVEGQRRILIPIAIALAVAVLAGLALLLRHRWRSRRIALD